LHQPLKPTFREDPIPLFLSEGMLDVIVEGEVRCGARSRKLNAAS
jgi:hypothetical protein